MNAKHRYFLMPSLSWHLFSDQILTIQPENLMLGHTQNPITTVSRPNTTCLEIPLLICVWIISAVQATAVAQKVTINNYPFSFPNLYSLFPKLEPLSCNYSCPFSQQVQGEFGHIQTCYLLYPNGRMIQIFLSH